MSLPTEGKLMALDLGTRRTGIAVSDEKQRVGFLREEVGHQSLEELFFVLEALIKQEKIVGLVIGLPLSMKGSESQQTKRVREQINKLKTFKLPILEMDERLSTKEAQRYGEGVVDSHAALILLEQVLSH